MKKYIIRIALISSTMMVVSSLFAVASFADTTSTGSSSTGTTSTGSSSTGSSSTGSSSTGSSSTGTTSTGTTSTGVCGTASGVNAELAVIQQAFLTEMTRLINEKGAAYNSAMSLSGTQRSDAIKAANEKYRIGVEKAIKTRESAKQNKSNHQCKEPKKEDCTTASGVKAELAFIQQAFLTEMTRLINEKGAAYNSAMSLSGTQRSDAIKAANEKYRIGVEKAIKTRESAKQNKSNHQCKEPKKEDRNDNKKDVKNQIKDIKKDVKNQIKDIKKDVKNQIKDIKKDVKKSTKKSPSKKRDRR